MIKRILISSFTLMLALGLAYAINVSAQTASSSLQSIQFPIASLGNCASQQACKTYCDDATHADACLTFAEQNGLMSKSEVERAKSFEALVAAGKTPGGCDSKDACQAYCHDQSHASECLQFAQSHGLISSQEAERAQTFLKNGGPGGCTSKDACEAYCNDPTHATECLNFAKQHGLIDPNTADQADQDMARLQSGLNGTEGTQLGQCLHSKLSQNGLDKVQSGQLTPDTTTLEKVRSCFAQVGKQVDQNAKDSISKAPQVVQTCIQSVLGSASFEDLQNGQPPKLEDAQKVRQCMEQEHRNDSESPKPLQTERPLPPQRASSSESDREMFRTSPPPPRPQFNPFPTNEPDHSNGGPGPSGPESFLGPQSLVGAIAHFFSR